MIIKAHERQNPLRTLHYIFWNTKTIHLYFMTSYFVPHYSRNVVKFESRHIAVLMTKVWKLFAGISPL